MSGLLSSFFIEPIARQARRLSGAAPHPHAQADANASANALQPDQSRSAEDVACGGASASSLHVKDPQPIPGDPSSPPQGYFPAAHHHHYHLASHPGSSLSVCHEANFPDSRQSPQCRSTSVPTHAQRRNNNNLGLGQALFDRFVPLTIRSAAVPTQPTTPPPRLPPSIQETEPGLMATVDSPVHVPVAEDPSCSERLEQQDQNQTASHIISIPTPDLPTMAANRHVDPLPSPQTPPRSRGGLPIRSRRTSPRDALTSVAEAFPQPSSLPADDGKQLLRQRIHNIRDLNLSVDEKARRMHWLMTESWQASQGHLRAQSPSSLTSPVRPRSSSSLTSTYSSDPTYPGDPPSSAPVLDPTNPYNIFLPDLLPSYRPNPPPSPSEESPKDEPTTPPELEFGCEHYKRNVKVQCYDCKTWHPCRHCHDAAQTTHALNRQATENMLCMACKTPQPAAQDCKECGMRAAWYYCDICKLWDDDAVKRIYHCVDCGICRRGEGIGKDFTHCKKCNVCIPIQSAIGHRCIERATECDCPICHEYMFNSPEAIVAMPCGHYLHQTCYAEYTADEEVYQCPICKKSAKNMEVKWRKLDSEIQQQPMPVHLRGMKVEIRCIDCAGRSRVDEHWLGNKCSLCDGYNTVVVRELGKESEGAAAAAELRRSVMRANMERRRGASFVPQPRARSYFQDEDVESSSDHNTERPSSAAGIGGEAGFGFGSTAYEMLARMSRSLNAEEGGAVDENVAHGRPSTATDAGDAGFGFGTTAYEVLARMSRSLSPIRHYFDSDGEESALPRTRVINGSAAEDDDGELSFWGESEDYVGDEDDSGDDSSDDEYDSDDSNANQELEEDEEEEESHGLDELDLQLIGHR